jgi:hypothetical protein
VPDAAEVADNKITGISQTSRLALTSQQCVQEPDKTKIVATKHKYAGRVPTAHEADNRGDQTYKQKKQIGTITATAEGCWSIQCQRFMLRGYVRRVLETIPCKPSWSSVLTMETCGSRGEYLTVTVRPFQRSS